MLWLSLLHFFLVQATLGEKKRSEIRKHKKCKTCDFFGEWQFYARLLLNLIQLQFRFLFLSLSLSLQFLRKQKVLHRSLFPALLMQQFRFSENEESFANNRNSTGSSEQVFGDRRESLVVENVAARGKHCLLESLLVIAPSIWG